MSTLTRVAAAVAVLAALVAATPRDQLPMANQFAPHTDLRDTLLVEAPFDSVWNAVLLATNDRGDELKRCSREAGTIETTLDVISSTSGRSNAKSYPEGAYAELEVLGFGRSYETSECARCGLDDVMLFSNLTIEAVAASTVRIRGEYSLVGDTMDPPRVVEVFPTGPVEHRLMDAIRARLAK